MVAGETTVRGLATLNQIEITPLSGHGVVMPETGERLLMVVMDLLPAVANADPHAWSEATHRLDKDMQLMINHFKHDASACLQIYPCNGEVYNLSASALRRFWRRRRMVSDFFDKTEGEKSR